LAFPELGLTVANDGAGIPWFDALEMRYSNMRADGLYFLTENFASAEEMSFLSSSRSNAPSARVIGYHLSLA
jgi:hypothetical protein